MNLHAPSPAGEPSPISPTEFLSLFHGDAPWQALAIKDREQIKAQKLSSTPRRAGSLTQWCGNWEARGHNIYFSIAQVRVSAKKAEKKDVESVEWLWVDADPATKKEVLQPAELNRRRQGILAVLQAPIPELPAPSILVDSGRGYWAFWRLKEPVKAADGEWWIEHEARGRGIQQAVGDALAAWGLPEAVPDSCFNIDRIARLPGTVNLKTGAVADLIFADVERRYALSDFPAVCEAPIKEKAGASGKAEFSPEPSSATLDTIDLSRLRPAAAAKVIDVIRNGPTERHPFGGNGKDRSAALWFVLCQCLRAGVSPDDLLAIVLDETNRISDHLREQNNPQGAAQRQIKRAARAVAADLASGAKDAPIGPDAGGDQDGPMGPSLATIDGVLKRVVTIEDLNRRFAVMQAPGLPSVYVSRPDFLPITDQDLKRRLGGEVVETGMNFKTFEPVYTPAFKVWTECATRHLYRDVVFTNKPVADDCYNLYRGLGVTPKPGNCELILNHIRDVICSGDDTRYTAMINLLAWQIQHVGEPSRIVVVLQNPNQQAGKGIFLEETMLKIYGPSGFSATATDQVLGRFNDALRGRAFIFLDEVLFAGDLRAADAIKSLATTTRKGIETKGLPIVECPLGVNLWLASNAENAVHIEDGDARYWILKINETRIGDHAYFAELVGEINNGGRDAFAHYLLSHDVSNFVPKRDVPRDNDERRAMIRQNINPYDARVWLEECARSEQILGMQTVDIHGNVGSVQWQADDLVSYADMRGAYVRWQATVKTRIAPRPTPSNRFGEILGKAGLKPDISDKNTRRRELPTVDKCLELLADAEQWRK